MEGFAGLGATGEHGTLLDAILALEESGNFLRKISDGIAGQKAEIALIDGKNGDLSLSGLKCHGEESAVSAKDAAGILPFEEIVGEGMFLRKTDVDAALTSETFDRFGKLQSSRFGRIGNQGQSSDGSRHDPLG